MPKELHLTITGRPISKKNSRDIFKNPRTGQLFPKNSDAYLKFEASVIDQLRDVAKLGYFDCPISIDYVFHMKGALDSDIDNMMGGVNDAIQPHSKGKIVYFTGIIKDDKLIRRGTYEKIPGCPDWRTELVIKKLEAMK